MAEQSAHNRPVPGSNPGGPILGLLLYRYSFFRSLIGGCSSLMSLVPVLYTGSAKVRTAFALVIVWVYHRHPEESA